jgi:hypothetical protein
MPVARVVLNAPHEQRYPPGENQDLAVLPEGDALPLQGDAFRKLGDWLA